MNPFSSFVSFSKINFFFKVLNCILEFLILLLLLSKICCVLFWAGVCRSHTGAHCLSKTCRIFSARVFSMAPSYSKSSFDIPSFLFLRWDLIQAAGSWYWILDSTKQCMYWLQFRMWVWFTMLALSHPNLTATPLLVWSWNLVLVHHFRRRGIFLVTACLNLLHAFVPFILTYCMESVSSSIPSSRSYILALNSLSLIGIFRNFCAIVCNQRVSNTWGFSSMKML